MVFFRKKWIYITFLLAGYIFVSCKTNYVYLTIENAQSAKDEFPDDIQSVTLMNRSMSNQFQNYPEDSLQMYFYRNNYQLAKIVLDSTAADTTMKALAALMFESGRYDVVIPVERNIPRPISFEQLPDTLTRDNVSEICTRFNTDALMVLERFYIKTMADLSVNRNVETESGWTKSYDATLDLKYSALFRIYKPGTKTLVREIAINDTIYWESSDFTLERLLSKLPSVKQALISAGIKIALDADNRLSPNWVPEKRGYFLFKANDDQGKKFMTNNDYGQAGKYWTEMAQSDNKRIRSKAEYNLALLSELNGDLDKAIEYGLKSYYSYYRYQTETYLKRLEARKKALKKTE